MKMVTADFEKWHIQFLPEDGARIEVLKYDGQDLLVSIPFIFKAPTRFFGEYETRPVYGYDDCFPTVDPCIYPGGDHQCRDHGEICWQKWHTDVYDGGLIFSTDCPLPDVNFKRILTFEGNRLTWRFEVTSKSGERAFFLHVMHALMAPDKIIAVELPEYRILFDETESEETGMKKPGEVVEYLLGIRPGSFKMLLLKEIYDGVVKLTFINGQVLEIRFDYKLFPTLGIWWNNVGYPEEGCCRTECAFEPIPGTCSDLSKSFNDRAYLSVMPGEKTYWEVIWTIN
jgi:hypothetical protein